MFLKHKPKTKQFFFVFEIQIQIRNWISISTTIITKTFVHFFWFFFFCFGNKQQDFKCSKKKKSNPIQSDKWPKYLFISTLWLPAYTNYVCNTNDNRWVNILISGELLEFKYKNRSLKFLFSNTIDNFCCVPNYQQGWVKVDLVKYDAKKSSLTNCLSLDLFFFFFKCLISV